jgi:hypothetical protein
MADELARAFAFMARGDGFDPVGGYAKFFI